MGRRLILPRHGAGRTMCSSRKEVTVCAPQSCDEIDTRCAVQSPLRHPRASRRRAGPRGRPPVLSLGAMLWAMAIALAGPAAGQDARGEEKSMSDTQVIDCPATVESLVLTVVVDNVPGREDLETAWGLAVLVQGAEKTVLFDTGPDGPLLLGNLRSLGIDPVHGRRGVSFPRSPRSHRRDAYVPRGQSGCHGLPPAVLFCRD